MKSIVMDIDFEKHLKHFLWAWEIIFVSQKIARMTDPLKGRPSHRSMIPPPPGWGWGVITMWSTLPDPIFPPNYDRNQVQKRF